MKTSFTSILVFLITVLFCAPILAQTPVPQLTDQPHATSAPKIDTILSMINETLLLGYLKTLVGFGPRATGTYGCEISAQYIHSQFLETGLKVRYQNWTSWGNRYNPHRYSGTNIEATLHGTEPSDDAILIFNAHYDSVRVSPGANDDGSGTAAVLAAAYVLSQFHFNRTIKFVTFAGEEVGLLGSQAYAKEAYEQDDNIMLEVNADMIGHDEGSRSIRLTATEDAGWAAEVFQSIIADHHLDLSVTHGNINRVGHKMTGSDYSPFLMYGWESVCCWETDPDDNMHTPNDNLENVNLSYLVNTTRTIVGALAVLADQPDTPPQVRITSPEVGYLYIYGMKKREINDFKTIVLDNIWIWVDVYPSTAQIEKAEFYDNGRLVFTTTEAPFKWHFNERSLRNHEITVLIYDKLGRTSTDTRQIRFINILKNDR